MNSGKAMMTENGHPDPYKMTVQELKHCGCPRCQDALRMHAVIDKLIEADARREEALNRIEAQVARLFRPCPSGANPS